MGVERRAPLHPPQERSNKRRSRVPKSHSVPGLSQVKGGTGGRASSERITDLGVGKAARCEGWYVDIRSIYHPAFLLTRFKALLQYQGSIANLRKSYEASADRSSTLISAYNPDSDLKALIERYRTGPFRPKAHVFESITHEECDNHFGIDLRKWVEGGWGSDEVRRDSLPPVFTTLMNGLNTKYGGIPDDSGWWSPLF